MADYNPLLNDFQLNSVKARASSRGAPLNGGAFMPQSGVPERPTLEQIMSNVRQPLSGTPAEPVAPRVPPGFAPPNPAPAPGPLHPEIEALLNEQRLRGVRAAGSGNLLGPEGFSQFVEDAQRAPMRYGAAPVQPGSVGPRVAPGAAGASPEAMANRVLGAQFGSSPRTMPPVFEGVPRPVPPPAFEPLPASRAPMVIPQPVDDVAARMGNSYRYTSDPMAAMKYPSAAAPNPEVAADTANGLKQFAPYAAMAGNMLQGNMYRAPMAGALGYTMDQAFPLTRDQSFAPARQLYQQGETARAVGSFLHQSAVNANDRVIQPLARGASGFLQELLGNSPAQAAPQQAGSPGLTPGSVGNYSPARVAVQNNIPAATMADALRPGSGSQVAAQQAATPEKRYINVIRGTETQRVPIDAQGNVIRGSFMGMEPPRNIQEWAAFLPTLERENIARINTQAKLASPEQQAAAAGLESTNAIYQRDMGQAMAELDAARKSNNPKAVAAALAKMNAADDARIANAAKGNPQTHALSNLFGNVLQGNQ